MDHVYIQISNVHYTDELYGDFYMCVLCETTSIYRHFKSDEYSFNYCPMCGARVIWE